MSTMLVPTIIMALMAATLLIIAWRRGGGEHIQGLERAWSTTLEIIPMLAFAFIIAGMVQELIPRELMSRWVGAESGFRGILIGSLAGGLSPGGPFVSMPLAATLLRSGAGVGTMVAYLTGWSLWSVARLPLEVGILGWKFTLIRLASTLVFPPIAGWIANALFSGVRL